MPGETAIEWTRGDDGAHGRTWNPVTGCTKVSAGCDRCYAERFAERFRGVAGHPYEQGFDLKLWPERLEIPLRWTKPHRVFVNSMADLWHADVPDEFIESVFAVMADAKQHTFMILTKRSQRMKRLMKKWHGEGGQFGSRGCLLPLPNVWLGVSIEDQEAAYRIDFLTRTPAAVRFLSCEPLIGGLDLTPWLFPANIGQFDPDGQLMATPARSLVDWVIAGGESGPGARPMHPDWARSLRDQCVSAGIPYFFKQWGEWLEVDGPRCQRLNQAASRTGVWMLSDGTVIPRGEERGRYFTPYSTSIMARVGKHKAGRELDGRTWDEFPGVMVG